MTWNKFATIITQKNWIYSIYISSSLVRISHRLSSPAPFDYGYLCQAQFLAGKSERYKVQRLLIDLEDYTIIEPDYSIPSLQGNQIRIGIKGQQTFEKTNIIWTVHLEQWQT